MASNWSQWLGELWLSYRVSEDGGNVMELSGTPPDQSALQGVLKRIWNLNLSVLSVTTSPPEAGGDGEPPAGMGE